ncbi:peptidylprolyl isomerase [Thiobacter aerophilum]|uniref:Peptidyl-prolyl cis-trans isomerase n=1 Tax=Thiobacter aerophilum TaxID=3121275 RepID=A0ABV0EF31_9BURK
MVEMKTTLGTIALELYPDKAPKTVENFLRYVKRGHYDGTIFHRVIDGFMIQGGGFDARFREKPTEAPISNEADNGLRNERYTIAMARTMEPHSATAQFFINVRDNDFLNHTAPTLRGWGYAVFGRVVRGEEVVDRITKRPTGPGGPFASDVPRQPVVIENMRQVQ